MGCSKSSRLGHCTARGTGFFALAGLGSLGESVTQAFARGRSLRPGLTDCGPLGLAPLLAVAAGGCLFRLLDRDDHQRLDERRAVVFVDEHEAAFANGEEI